MPEFDGEMARKAMVNSIFLQDSMRDYSFAPGDFNIQIKSIKDQSCFRIRLQLPTLLHFHYAIERLRKIQPFHTGQGHTFPVGFFPAYNCNLNHLTLLRTYEHTSDWNDRLGSYEDEDYFSIMLYAEKGEPVEQSSLNFLLQNNAKPKQVPVDISAMINRCFEHMYWRPPLEDLQYDHSPIHNFIYHSSSRISELRRVYKTVIKITDIGRRRYSLGKSEIRDYVEAKASVMCQDKDGLFFRRMGLWVAEPDATHLKPDDIADCIMEKPIIRGARHMPIMIHSVIGDVLDGSCLEKTISACVWKRLHKISDSTNICKIDHLDNIKRDVYSLIERNKRIFGNEWIEGFDRKFSASLKNLFPLIFDHEGEVYHAPPPLIGYVLVRKLPVLQNSDALVEFLNFVDMIDPQNPFGSKTKLRMSGLGERIQSGSAARWEDVLKEIPRVANRVMYSRVFSRASFDVMQ